MAGSTMDDQAALVLLSGGQDSATCLAWALERFARVETLGFDYGQRNRAELACRDELRGGIARDFPRWAARLGADHVLALPALNAISDSALTRDLPITAGGAGALPSTFVPGRNVIFLTFAAALAYGRGLKHLVAGMCETDYSGYPDCRDDTLKALQVALNLGMDRRFVIHTPLMWRDKAATWSLARALGGDSLLALLRTHTLSCYEGDRTQHHEWGDGCAVCPACVLRARGWRKFAAAG
ncbi:MAG TPA: 7-cyano-7-deazaguanine synthase QueC [Stellaceae bacterium]|nr:7-cyano-7-deazaguanine synthase QueC [Stellaceae bacterium]